MVIEADAAGLAEIERGVTLLRSVGSAAGAPGSMGIMADAQARLGNAAALAIARAGLDVAQATGQNFWDAELHRLVGIAQAELAGPDDPDAEAALHRAIEVARSQGAISLELRSAVSLAQYCQRAAAARKPAPLFHRCWRDSRTPRARSGSQRRNFSRR